MHVGDTDVVSRSDVGSNPSMAVVVVAAVVDAAVAWRLPNRSFPRSPNGLRPVVDIHPTSSPPD